MATNVVQSRYPIPCCSRMLTVTTKVFAIFSVHLLAVNFMKQFPQKEERISTFCFVPLIHKHLFAVAI